MIATAIKYKKNETRGPKTGFVASGRKIYCQVFEQKSVIAYNLYAIWRHALKEFERHWAILIWTTEVQETNHFCQQHILEKNLICQTICGTAPLKIDKYFTDKRKLNRSFWSLLVSARQYFRGHSNCEYNSRLTTQTLKLSSWYGPAFPPIVCCLCRYFSGSYTPVC